MTAATVGVHLMMKDESDLLAQCLKSVKDADEIIVVDTGSRDSSVSIAKAYGAKVYDSEWDDDFSKPRNVALRQANTDWILYLDADECLLTGITAVKELLLSSEAEAFTVLLENVLGAGPEDRLLHRSVRIFRNRRDYEFQGRIHEQIDASIIQKHGAAAILDSAVTIRHFGYLPGRMKQKGKLKRNERLLKKALADCPDDPFYLYNMGITCCQSGRLEEARAFLTQALPSVSSHAPYRAAMVKNLCQILLELGDVKQAEIMLAGELERYGDYPDLDYMLGQSLERQGLLERAYEAYRNASTRTGDKYVTEAGMGSFRPLAKMGELALKRDLPEDAARLFHQALRHHNQYAPALVGIANAFQMLDVADAEISAFLWQTVNPRTSSDQAMVVEVLYGIGAFGQILASEPTYSLTEPRIAFPLSCSLIHTGQLIEANRILNLCAAQSEEGEPDARLFHIWAICQLLHYESLQEDFLALVPIRLRDKFHRLDHRLREDGDWAALDEGEELNELTKELIGQSVSLGQLDLGRKLAELLPDGRLDYAKALYREGYTMKAADLFLALLGNGLLDEEGLFLLGEILFDKGHYLQAAELFEQLLQNRRDDEKTGTATSLCYLHLAEASLAEVLHRVPDAAPFKDDLQNIRSSIRLLNGTAWHTNWSGRQRRIRHEPANDIAVHDREE